jgi:hypothetical protein
MIPFHFSLPGALAAGTSVKRLIVPFAYEIEGVTASVNTAPAGGPTLFDVLAGANGTAPGALVSVFTLNAAGRPSIAAGAYDNAPASGPDQPAVTGDRATEPSYTQYLARPQAPAQSQFAGNQPVNMQSNQPQSVQVNPTEAGTPNQPNESPNTRWGGNAGDALQVAVVAGPGNTGLGSDATVVVWVVET